MSKLKLHIAEIEDFSESVLQDMGQRFELTTGPVTSLKLILDQVDIFWMRLGYIIDSTVLTPESKCKIIATPVTGIDHIDENLCQLLGVKIICLRGEKEFLKEVRATAEHSLLLTMMLMRRCVPAVIDVENGNWIRDKFRGHEIYKKKIGVLGLGRLGSIVAEYYQAMGCQIYYYDIVDIEADERYIKLESAESIVEHCDIISIHIPYNDSTHHVYRESFFLNFTRTKWLVNTSRGGVIDEQCLLKILQENKIAGAALDVLEGEPNISDNILVQYASSNDNLIITPHIGGNTFESFEKTERFIADRIIDSIL